MNAETRLFNYLRDIIFEEDAGRIDLDEIPNSLQELAQGLQMLSVWMKEVKQLSNALSSGDLETVIPVTDNPLADSLKALHATMRHITWQAQQISKGDYSQKVDYLGEFSIAFNSMTRQLAEREVGLKESRDEALRVMALLQKVTDRFGDYILVIGKNDQSDLYQNVAFRSMEKEQPQLAKALRLRLRQQTKKLAGQDEIWEFYLNTMKERMREGKKQTEGWYFQVETQFLVWSGQDAAVHIIEDISEARMQQETIETLAFSDELTGLYNRSYIMREFESWLKDGFCFSLAFIDLDSLKFANDEFGHAEGDRYICQVADLLSKDTSDRQLARIGGDEFLLLEKNCTDRQLEQELEDKRNFLVKQSKEEGSMYKKSFSYGVVEVLSTSRRTKSSLLREADRRMYQYKLKHKPKI